MSLKKCFKRIFGKILIFEILAKNGQFLPFLAIFSQKIRFLDTFFESAHQICLKLGQKLGTIALNHQMAVLCLENSCFARFGHFWVKNTLLVVTLYGFGLFLAIFFQTVDDFLLIFVIYAKFHCLKMVNEKFCSDKKIGAIFGSFFGPKFDRK